MPVGGEALFGESSGHPFGETEAPMAQVTEIREGVFRIATYVEPFQLQFVQFLIRDEQPLLYHTGPKAMFPAVREAVAEVLPPESIRWIGFSHFEADECGALNEWLAAAPEAEPVCAFVGAEVNIRDFADRPPRTLQDGETLPIGERNMRMMVTPHVPHAWDAVHLFDEKTRTLFSSDVLHQNGDVEPSTEGDVLGRCEEFLGGCQAGPLQFYLPWASHTAESLERLAGLQPEAVAPMHGSTYVGDGAAALRGFGEIWQRSVAGGD
jgi:flavorubredoxin